MAQVKKPEVRQAILDAAFALFAKRGYHGTTMQAIATRAKVSVANVYVYFASKLDMLYAIYDPWMRERLTRLEGEMNALATPRDRLALLFRTLWHDIPEEENGFVVNIMQALSAAIPEEGYRPTLITWMEERIAAMIATALPSAQRDAHTPATLSHLAIMALNGFTIYRRLNPALPCDERTLTLMCDMLLGAAPMAPPRRSRSRKEMQR